MYRESSFIVTSTSIVLSDQSFWYSQQTRKHSSLLYLALFLNDFIVEWHRGSQVYIFSRPLSWTPHLGILLFSSLPHILHLIHQERATLKSYLGSNRFSPPPLLPAKSQPPMFLVWIILVLHLHPPPTRSLPAFSSCPITVYSQHNSQGDPIETCIVVSYLLKLLQWLLVSLSISQSPCYVSRGPTASGYPTPTPFIWLFSSYSSPLPPPAKLAILLFLKHASHTLPQSLGSSYSLCLATSQPRCLVNSPLSRF